MIRHRRRNDAAFLLTVATGLAILEAAASFSTSSLEAGLVAFVRVTARTSVVWFVLVFAASPLVALRPGPATKWLLRNRRSLGLAMAISHGAHLAGIGILAARHGATFWSSLAPTTLIGGGLGYLLLAAMVITSTDRSALRMGRRAWRALHLTGMWWFWSIFTVTYAGQIGRGVFPALATSVLIAVACLRVAVVFERAGRARRLETSSPRRRR